MNSGNIADLPKRRLGRTNERVTPVGIGGASFGGGYTQSSSDEDTIVALERAAELGFGYVDTSPHYGESERRIGLAFKNNNRLRDQFFLATKTGTGEKPEGCTGDRHSADWTYRSVERSLDLLNTDYIDLMQIHDPQDLEPSLAPGAALSALLDLKEQGVIGAIGLGVRSHEFLLTAIEHESFDTILTYADFNLVRQTARENLFGPAEEHDVGIILGSPILFGFLSNNPEKKLEKHSRDRSDPDVQKALDLYQWTKHRGIKLMSLAVQYCLREPRVAVVLVGTRNVEQVEEFAASALDSLPADIWDELEEEFGIH